MSGQVEGEPDGLVEKAIKSVMVTLDAEGVGHKGMH